MSFLRPKNRLIPLILALVVATGGVAFAKRQSIRDGLFKIEQGPVPQAVTREDFLKEIEPAPQPEPAPEPEPTPVPVNEPPKEPINEPDPKPPAEINLSVVFIPQAPKQVWDEIHEETCEEAVMAMLNAYLKDRGAMTVEEMENELLAIVDYQNRTLGYYKSTDTATTAQVMSGFYGLDRVKVVPLTSIEQVKEQIASGRPVMLPTAGRKLKNPYFKGEGPIYHMVLAKGYTADRIITNDPGTKRGADYTYANDVLWEAIGEWTGSDMDTTKKTMIIVE